MTPFTYPEVGATGEQELPPGYRHLRYRTRLGTGAEVMRTAAEAVLTFRMHRGTGMRVEASGPRAAAGVRVTSWLGVGPVRLVAAPCRVVWAADGDDRAGFGYGTLPGHPARGEESFVVTLADDRSVWFTVTSFSRPGRWYTRAAGPVVPLLQRAFARRCARALRRRCRPAR